MIAEGTPKVLEKKKHCSRATFLTIKSYTDCAGIEPRLCSVDLAPSSLSHVTVYFVPIGACCMWRQQFFTEDHMVHKRVHKLREQNGQF